MLILKNYQTKNILFEYHFDAIADQIKFDKFGIESAEERDSDSAKG